MRVAIFSDIHGNITGMNAVLAHLDSIGGADVLFAAGDIIGGGPGAEDLLDLLIERRVRMVRGNAEESALDVEAMIHQVPEHWQRLVRETARWLHERMSQQYWELLAALPLHQTIELDQGHKLLVCHATPSSPWNRVCAPTVRLADLRAAYGGVDAEVVAYGHWHEHHVLTLDSKLLVNVASVGLRKDGLSAFTLLEHTEGHWIVRQFQVPYDTGEEARLSVERDVPQP